MKIIVIGSGMAGLTAAAYLSVEGHEVIIFEQFPEIGGATATIRHEGFGWDLGVMLVSGFERGDRANGILADLGIEKQVNVIQGDRGTSFPDFNIWKPKDYKGPYWRRDYLKGIFPQESQGLDDYYKFYDQMLVLSRCNNQLDHMTGIKALFQKIKLWLLFQKVKEKKGWSAIQLMNHYFSDPKLKAVFTAILADLYAKPSEFPALGIPLVEEEAVFDKRIAKEAGISKPSEGYSYIAGGCGKLVEAFSRVICENGGMIHTNSEVLEILIEDNKARGVTLKNGEKKFADVVIASGGAHGTFMKLIPPDLLPEKTTKQIESLVPMESVFEIHLGVNFNPGKYQKGALCYYYFSYDVEEDVTESLKGLNQEEIKGFLFYIPTLHSPELAPKGCHSVSIITIASNILNNGTWEERKDDFAEKLIAEVEKHIPGLKEGIITKVILTPDDFRKRLHQDHHSYGGFPPTLDMDLPSHETPFKNLWFIGAQSNNLGGVKPVMLGARDTARKIIANQKKKVK